MSYFSFFVNIEGKRGLIVGGGEEIIEWLEEKRSKLKEKFPTEKARKQVIRTLYLTCVEKHRSLTKEEYETLIASLLKENK